MHFADTETLLHSKNRSYLNYPRRGLIEDELDAGPRSTIHEGATVSGVVKDFAKIGANAVVAGSRLSYSSEVEPYAKVSDSDIGNSSIVLEGAEIDSSTVGNDSEIGVRSKIDHSRVGDAVLVGSWAILKNGSIVTDGASVATGETIPTNGVRISEHQTVV